MKNEIIENSDEIDTEEDQVEVEASSGEAFVDGHGDVHEPDAEAAEDEVEVNPISELIGSIENKDFVSASTMFNDMVGQRMQTALDAEKIALADTLYNNTPENTTDEIPDENIEIDTEEDITAEQEEAPVAAA